MTRRPETIHDLYQRVRSHPDYVFGALFVPGDFPGSVVPEDFPAKYAEETLAETGNGLIALETQS